MITVAHLHGPTCICLLGKAMKTDKAFPWEEFEAKKCPVKINNFPEQYLNCKGIPQSYGMPILVDLLAANITMERYSCLFNAYVYSFKILSFSI